MRSVGFNKTRSLTIRLTKEDMDFLKWKCKEARLSQSEYIRLLVRTVTMDIVVKVTSHGK